MLHSIYGAVSSLDAESYLAQKDWHVLSGHTIKHHPCVFLSIPVTHKQTSLPFSVLKTCGRKITSKGSDYQQALFLAGNLSRELQFHAVPLTGRTRAAAAEAPAQRQKGGRVVTIGKPLELRSAAW